jgi:hypothetical protein
MKILGISGSIPLVHGDSDGDKSDAVVYYSNPHQSTGTGIA